MSRNKLTDMWAQVGFYTSLGFIIPGGMVGGYFLGWLLDQHLHTGQVLSIIGAGLGAAGGIIEVIQILTRAEKDQGSGRSSQ